MKILTTCDECNSNFYREEKELKRIFKLGRKKFCSRACVGRNHTKTVMVCADRPRRDEFTGFRIHLTRCKSRHHLVTLSLEDIKRQWETQDGVCPYTKIKLDLNRSTRKFNQASIDRIDSSLGYIPGNIQFISIMANFAKADYPEDEFFKFLEAIKKS